jgi:HPt (histidine-containing phosphotransfer) domain-containing protein
LYSKIVGFLKKTVTIGTGINDSKANALQNELFVPDPASQTEKIKNTDLEYLIRRTKSNPTLMMEMILLYLEQTPPLINAMKQSLQDEDWNLLQSAVHKMIPSFSIMGISSNYENMAKKIQEYAHLNDKVGQAYLSAQVTKTGDDKISPSAFPVRADTSLLNRQELYEMVLQLEKVCGQACIELEEEFKKIKNQN